MKIAVLISGQLRNWKVAVESQQWFWSTSGVEVDYFVHTWDYSMDRTALSKPYINRKISKQEFDYFIELYKPKKSILDTKKQEYFYDNDHWSSLFYSFAQTVLLKREYELQNNFEYDVVFKSRPDVCFNPEEPLSWPPLEDNLFLTTHGGFMENEFRQFNLNDCIFCCNSYTMDLLANLYFYRQKKIHVEIDKENYRNYMPIGPGVLMHEFFRDYGITPLPDLPFIETLIKEGCPTDLHLLDVDQWKIMEKYFRDWYRN